MITIRSTQRWRRLLLSAAGAWMLFNTNTIAQPQTSSPQIDQRPRPQPGNAAPTVPTAAVTGNSDSAMGVVGASTSTIGVFGRTLGTGYGLAGVKGSESSGGSGSFFLTAAVLGDAHDAIGVIGSSFANDGVLGYSSNANGVHGISTSGAAVSGASTTGYSGYFSGKFAVVNGDVGIGTASPVTRFQIATGNACLGPYCSNDGNANGRFIVGGSGAEITFLDRAATAFVTFPTGGQRWVWYSYGGTAHLWSGDDKLSIFANGDVVIPGTLEVQTLDTAGTTALCRSLNKIALCSSSLRYKRDLSDFTGGLDLLDRLRPVSFSWKDHPERDLGLVAEEVAEVEPLLITRNANGEIEGVKYDRLTVVLVNAIREQQRLIQQLQDEVGRLSRR